MRTCEDGCNGCEHCTDYYTADDFVTLGGGPPGDPNGELAQLHADLRDFLRHVIDMAKGDHYLDVVRGNAEALLRREALKE